PVFMVLPECSEIGLFSARGIDGESLISLSQDRPPQEPLSSVVDTAGRKSPQFSEIMFFKIVLSKQRLQINEIRVAGEGRETLIRRIPESGGPQGADLPVLQTGINQEIDEMSRFPPKCANSSGPRQACRMQQDASCPIL